MRNLASIGPVVSEKMFKKCGRRRTTEACLYYQIGLGEQNKNNRIINKPHGECFVYRIFVVSIVKFYIQEIHKLASRPSLISYPCVLICA